MSDQLSPQAEAAYRRAVSAYQKGSYDEAQRWAREALAIEPAHVAAAALLRRLGGRETGPQIISTDPTVLVSGSGGYEMAEPPDPTVIAPRKIPRPTPPNRNPVPPSPPHRSPGRRTSEPTVIVSPSNAGSSTLGNASLDRRTGSLWRRLLSGGGRQDGRFPAGRSTPRRRGILIVAGAIALAAVSVWGVIRAIQWLSPEGERLTIEAAAGGRIVGDGIRCGSGSSRCSTAIPKGERVDLTAEAESGYEFAAFTGDCEASRGSLLMDGPKTCGARFERLGPPSAAAMYTLSIEKPKGGTILFQEVITCGSLGSDCSEDIRAQELVTLRFQPDDGYVFDSFFPECSGGEVVMNSARTCGAVFLAAPTPTVNRLPIPKPGEGAAPDPRSGARLKADQRSAPGDSRPASKEQTPSRNPPPGPDKAVSPPVTPTPVPPTPASQPSEHTPQKPTPPPAAPDTMEEHAKKEIKQRVEEYCSALETLKPEEVQKVFPRADARTLKRQFDGYRSLKCSLAADLQYDRFDIGTPASAAASAQVKVGMKQTLEMRTGGAPKSQEMTFTILLSRIDLRSRWKIDDVIAAEKK